jgi:tripartite-type tricarboxylate transporter receptor subunit TctC
MFPIAAVTGPISSADRCRSFSAPYPRASSTSGAARSDVLPDIPTLAEFVPGYEASQWYGVGAPKDTPAEVIDKLNNEISAVAADPLIKARLAGLGVDPMSMTSAAFGKLIADETEKWGKVIRFAGIKSQ